MSIPEAVRTRVRARAGERCGYCRAASRHIYAPMEVEHIIPKSLGGSDDEDNLWLACPRCNRFKAEQTHSIDPETETRTTLFNPHSQHWSEHFAWGNDQATIIGQTPCGRATVIALQLNYSESLELRREWVELVGIPRKD